MNLKTELPIQAGLVVGSADIRPVANQPIDHFCAYTKQRKYLPLLLGSFLRLGLYFKQKYYFVF